MSVSMKSKGFTLVEMLVVIAIIAILAASLFPKIKDAMNSARATSLMTKGRGIYNAVITANAAREPHGLSQVWPMDVSKDIVERSDDGKTGDAIKYFTYLMSCDEKGKYNKVAAEGERIAADLSPESFSGDGTVPVKDNDFTSENCVWNVCAVNDSDPSSIPFLITKNFQEKEITYTAENAKLPLTEGKPFGSSLAVWITVGGSAQKAERIYFRDNIIMGNNDTNVYVWVCPPKK